MKKRTDSDKIDELVEVVGFIKDRMVTKEYLEEQPEEQLTPIKNELSALNCFALCYSVKNPLYAPRSGLHPH